MPETRIKVEKAIKLIADGQLMYKACAEVGVSLETFRQYCTLDTSLHLEYSRAREFAAHLEADQAVQISDEELDPQRARNRIEVRKWRASRFNQKQFGDKVDVQHNGQIDLVAAIEQKAIEAKARTLPDSYLSAATDAQAIEYTSTVDELHTGQKPVDDKSLEEKRADFFS